MVGTIVNTVAIVAGSLLGGTVRRGLSSRHSDVLFTAMGLAAMMLGIHASVSHIPKSQYPVLFIFSLAVGGLIGTALNLDGRVHRLTRQGNGSSLVSGLTTGVLLYCVGTLSMVGPVMSALYGDHTYLFTNAMLDLVTSAVLASTYGYGMLLAAPILFVWQGCIYLLALYARDFVSDDLLNELSIVGGVLITTSGLGILNIKDCRTLNLLPSLFIPILFFWLKAMLF